jgi:hypothetical protein
MKKSAVHCSGIHDLRLVKKNMSVDCALVCVHVCGGLVHAIMVGGPLSLSSHPLFFSVTEGLKPEIITKYVALSIFKK